MKNVLRKFQEKPAFYIGRSTIETKLFFFETDTDIIKFFFTDIWLATNIDIFVDILTKYLG